MRVPMGARPGGEVETLCVNWSPAASGWKGIIYNGSWKRTTLNPTLQEVFLRKILVPRGGTGLDHLKYMGTTLRIEA